MISKIKAFGSWYADSPEVEMVWAAAWAFAAIFYGIGGNVVAALAFVVLALDSLKDMARLKVKFYKAKMENMGS